VPTLLATPIFAVGPTAAATAFAAAFAAALTAEPGVLCAVRFCNDCLNWLWCLIKIVGNVHDIRAHMITSRVNLQSTMLNMLF